jgi:hypothetical protein
MSEIRIEESSADCNVIQSEISYSPDLRRFFSGEDFHAEYSVDISDVPETVLTVPVLAQVCPVAWMQGADVYVDTVDATFLDSLLALREALLDMYPDLMEGGDIYYRESVEQTGGSEFEGAGLLFTGGVDSTSSFVRHRDENPALINIQGWTVRLDDHEKWQGVKGHLEKFGSDHGVANLYVRSNMMSFLNNVMLIAHSDPNVGGAWYSSVGHGVGLPGLCAPLAYATGITDLYMSPSQWDGIELPWGSRPEIVDNVAWSRTETHLTGFEDTRQERIQTIADYVKTGGANDVTLVVCSDETGQNCGRCEKCCRTAVGLLLAGLDPSDHGIPFDSRTFSYIRKQFESGNWDFRKDEHVHHWEDLQSHASVEETQYEGTRQFLEWLREANFEMYANHSRVSLKDKSIYTVYRNIPHTLFNTLDNHLRIGPF